LNERLERRRDELARQAQLALGDLVHVGSAWVLPHPEREGELAPMVSDPEIERIAVEVAMRYEREHGFEPESVRAGARLALAEPPLRAGFRHRQAREPALAQLDDPVLELIATGLASGGHSVRKVA
jgi:hypothetical protein